MAALSLLNCRWTIWLGVIALLYGVFLPTSLAQTSGSALEQRLLDRIRQNPSDASGWRLLGRWRLDHGDTLGAVEACETAVRWDASSASAHFDLARALTALGRSDAAAFHFAEASRLAPDSEYAQESQGYLRQTASSVDASLAAFTEHDDEPNRFGGVPVDEEIAPESPSPFNFRLAAGMLYNTNLQLAPLSRTVFTQNTESFQLFAAPEMELRAWESDAWTLGAALSGYFTLNEEEFRGFNVQSYRPGVFVERAYPTDAAYWVGRLQYNFEQNLFDGQDFAKRHSVISSVEAEWNPSTVSRAYWAIDYSNFTVDGVDPALTSQDGWTNTLGVSHEYDPEWGALERLRSGVDVQMAELQGANFAYNSVFIYGESEISLLTDVWAVFQLGWGYRDYPDFVFVPSRNENMLRYGAELHKQWNEHWRVTGLLTYDRFDSANEFYAADRYLGGVMVTYLH